MPVFVGWFVRSQPFQPFQVIMMQAGFIIINEYGSRDMHGIHQAQPFTNPACLQDGFHIPGDIDKSCPGGNVEPEFLSKRFHQLSYNILLSIFNIAIDEFQHTLLSIGAESRGRLESKLKTAMKLSKTAKNR
jgi:hypothetical protein